MCSPTGGGWGGVSDTGGGGSVDRELLEYLGDPAGPGKNDIVINGVIAWIYIVQDGPAEMVWKAQADSHFIDTEISEAKEALWKASKANLGDTVNRQGENKKKKEIDDISEGLKKLKSLSKVPLILATGKMMAKAPPFGGISDSSSIPDIIVKVKTLEESMESFMKKQSDQIKELTEVVTVSMCHSQKKPAVTVSSTLNETPRTKKRRLENILDDETTMQSQRQAAPPAQQVMENLDPGVRNYAAVAAAQAGLHPNHSVEGITPMNQYRGTPSNQQRFRKRSVLVYGNATTGKDDAEEILAADIELVATGVAKDATIDQLKEFVMAKGINVLEIIKLTTFEHARTHTFKIKIKAAQYNEAMKPENWPFRVGVRHYRQPRNTGSSWREQAGRAGGVVSQPQGGPQHQQYRPPQKYRQQQGYNYNHRPSYHHPQSQTHSAYHHQYQQPPQYQSHNVDSLELQNRYVVDGFANEVNN